MSLFSRSSYTGTDIGFEQLQTVLQHDQLSPTIRVWFARLQMPVMNDVLKSLKDFRKEGHSALRLVKLIGTVILDAHDCVLPRDLLEQEVMRLALLIEQSPHDRVQVYEQANREFEQILAAYRLNRHLVQEIECAACNEEQRETFTIQYAANLNEALGNKRVGGDTRQFVLKVWTAVLAESTVRKGAQHQDTLDLNQTALDLISVCEAFHARVDPLKAVRAVPRLVQKLRFGMALIGLPTNEQDTHIKLIGTNLTDAFLAQAYESVHHSPLSEVKAFAYALGKCAIDGMEVTEDDSGWQLWDCAIGLDGVDPDGAGPVLNDATNQPRQELSLPVLDYWAISLEPRKLLEKIQSHPELATIQTIERDHPRIGAALRDMWLSKEFVPFVNQLIINGGDGLANRRRGFNENIATSLLELLSLHEERFGLPSSHATIKHHSLTAIDPVPGKT